MSKVNSISIITKMCYNILDKNVCAITTCMNFYRQYGMFPVCIKYYNSFNSYNISVNPLSVIGTKPAVLTGIHKCGHCEIDLK